MAICLAFLLFTTVLSAASVSFQIVILKIMFVLFLFQASDSNAE
jgi:hypothetical protein